MSAPARQGRLFGIGVGPGDPELMTLKAVRLLGEARLVVSFSKKGAAGHARTIAAPHIPAGTQELVLTYPVTVERAFDSPEYTAALAAFYADAADALAGHLAQGRDVALICEGDPLFYGSFMHLHARLRGRFETEICPGVTGMSGCWAAAGEAMTWGDDVLSVLPGTLPEAELTRRLRDADAAVIMKLGTNFGKVRRAVAAAGLTERAVYVERGTMQGERVAPLREMTEERAPYFALILVPGRGRRP